MSVLAVLVCLWAGNLFLRGSERGRAQGTVNPQSARLLRLGLAPEQDIFKRRKAYRALGDYLEEKHAAGSSEKGFRVELVTASSYAGVLQDFEEGRIDAAFVGSLVAVVARDRYGAQVVLKSEEEPGASTYSGVVFVLDQSPARSFDDLKGKRLGAVRTTMGGAVYPLYLMTQAGMPAGEGGKSPELVWSGTHDDVIREVVFGNLDAGAVKDLRLLAYERAHPEVHLRKISESVRVPDNALMFRRDFPAQEREMLVRTLLKMHEDPHGTAARAELHVQRFLPCDIQQYAGLYEMLGALGPRWSELKLEGPAPRRPPEVITPAPTSNAGEGH